MVEGANLIMMEGRHIAGASTPAAAEGELAPAQIEVLVSKDRGTWNKLAREFNAAAIVALKAVEAKDAEAVLAAGDGIDTACENCHLRYWYPDQEKLFLKKPAR